MTDGDALLKAILDRPEDDVARLVYADWLEENGSPARAAFIRGQIDPERFARRPAGYSETHARWKGCLSLTGQQAREWGLWPWNAAKFTVRYRASDRAFVLTSRLRISGRVPPTSATVRRGFVESVRVTALVWDYESESNPLPVLTRHPLARVVLTGCEHADRIRCAARHPKIQFDYIPDFPLW